MATDEPRTHEAGTDTTNAAASARFRVVRTLPIPAASVPRPRSRMACAAARWLGCLVVVLALAGCEQQTVQSPFGQRPEFDAGETAEPDADVVSDLLVADDEAPEDEERDPTLGGRCLDDEQCDDGIACTFDECDLQLERCRFTPDDSSCQDGLYCNGREECRSGIGCRAGEPVSCDDQSPCSVDRCVEETMECERIIRDIDGDGDPDAHCVASGGDCNDQDARVSSLRAEVCDNRRDDDCDGVADEPDCERPAFDTCDAPLEIDAPTTVRVPLDAAGPDSAASCSDPGAADVVLAVEVEEPADVTITVRGEDPTFSAALRRTCEDATGELQCERAVEVSADEAVLRLRLSNAEGTYALVLFDPANRELEVTVEYAAPASPSQNETCASAEPLVVGRAITASVFGASPDVDSACHDGEGDLLYVFELEEERDVRVFATPVDPRSQPVVSLRAENCALIEDELACTNSADVELFARRLSAGEYYLSVSAALATDIDLLLLADEPSEAPPGETCDQPRELPLGSEIDVDLALHSDEHSLSCHPAGKDVVFELELAEASDVLVRQRFTFGDEAAVALLGSTCEVSEPLACALTQRPPGRAVAHNLAQGKYFVVVESTLGNPVQILAAARRARPPVVVVGADGCDDAQPVPSDGGYFTGNTNTASRDFTASCDVGNVPEGAPDQLLRLELEERSRVLLDAVGSGFRTVINLRQGPDCPGTQVPLACAAAPDESSYIEAVLEPGTYFVQVDGFGGDSGQWNLDIFVEPVR